MEEIDEDTFDNIMSDCVDVVSEDVEDLDEELAAAIDLLATRRDHLPKHGTWFADCESLVALPQKQERERAVDKPLRVAAERHSSEIHRRRQRHPSRLAMLVWSKADEVAAELEELTKSQVWVDALAYTAEKGAPIQQMREFNMSLTHLHHADFDTRFRQKLTKRWPLRLLMICKRGSAVKCPARLNDVRSLLDEDETLLEITTLKFKSMFHTELQEVVLEQGERGRHKPGV